MKVLMFGWEFPPHISGGLGTACLGLTQSLTQEGTRVLFVVPRAYGDEQGERIEFVDASSTPVPNGTSSHPAKSHLTRSEKQSKHKFEELVVPSSLKPYVSEGIESGVWPWNQELPKGAIGYTETNEGRRYKFSGGYGPSLLEEVKRYAEVAAAIARQNQFDVIHVHDWLTFPSGVAAKKASGKPLIVHVHATELDRSGAKADKRIFQLEKEGMMAADKVVTVSNWTKKIVRAHYGIPETKIEVVYNGVSPKEGGSKKGSLPPIGKPVVTFLGRITHQKGPEYFVEAARLVSEKVKDVHFVMAGAGDMLPGMIERVAQLRMSSHFHFTGFLKGNEVDRVWQLTHVYVMPSVSEPFGIAPLEAMQAGVPVIISKQSGVAEVVKNAIKIDFWDVKNLATAIIKVLQDKKLSTKMKSKSGKEVDKVSWKKAAKKVNAIYRELV